MKPFQMIRHAFKMVQRTLKSYVMLSVTIILSFGLLLGYLVYTDSALYNKYKKVFQCDRNVLYIVSDDSTKTKLEMLLEQTAKMENTYHYIQYESKYSVQFFEDNRYRLENGNTVQPIYISLCSIPNKVWGLYEETELEVTYLDGKQPEGIVLNKGEAFVDETTFRLLGLDQMEEPIYRFAINNHIMSETYWLPVRIVGIIKTNSWSENSIETMIGNTVSLKYQPKIIFSVDDVNPDVLPELGWNYRIFFYSETPELVGQAADRLGTTVSISTGEGTSLVAQDFGAIDVYSTQNEALESMQREAKTKAVIAAALVLLLGINLYSSFTNALNDRKFEIGVKRALGAKSWDIVRQFLYESMFVLWVDIIVSIALVADVFLVYKVIYEAIPDEFGLFYDWIIYISPYSVAMFGVCSIGLTIVFSFIFAYKSTQVEIVQYLKAE